MSRENESVANIIMTAVACNDVATVEAMCKSATKVALTSALRFAVFKHHDLNIVRLLGERIEELLWDNGIFPGLLTMALQRNNIAAFDVLMEIGVHNRDYQKCLHEAVMRGYTQCVQKILPRCDISSFGHQLLAQACFNQYEQMVDLLYAHCDPHQALEFLNQEKVTEDRKHLLVERIERERLHQTLSAATCFDKHSFGTRKI